MVFKSNRLLDSHWNQSTWRAQTEATNLDQSKLCSNLALCNSSKMDWIGDKLLGPCVTFPCLDERLGFREDLGGWTTGKSHIREPSSRWERRELYIGPTHLSPLRISRDIHKVFGTVKNTGGPDSWVFQTTMGSTDRPGVFPEAARNLQST